MVRLAIIVAASQYDAPTNDLPQVVNDVALVRGLLDATGKYEVLQLLDCESAQTTKRTLSEFVSRHQDTDVLETLFYFSGHGTYRAGDFHYALRNTRLDRIRDTALSNSELDDLLGALSPELTVKIVDACHSGVSYIKDVPDGGLDEHIARTKERFTNCYFLFSSSREQYSFAGRKLSNFTKALIDAVRARETGPVRYADLVNALRDSFEGDQEQQPFFVTQGSHTEALCDVTQELRDTIDALLEPVVEAPSDADDFLAEVVRLVRNGAASFVGYDAAVDKLASLGDRLRRLQLPDGLRALYKLESKVGVASSLHFGAAQLGEWVERNNTDVLARPTFKTKTMPQSYFDRARMIPAEKYESDEVDGYRHTISMPWSCFEAALVPKEKNLHPFLFVLVPFLTRFTLVAARVIAEEHYRTWDRTEPIEKADWRARALPLEAADLEQKFLEELNPLWSAVAKHVAGQAGLNWKETKEFVNRIVGAG